jgi:hypothetical protein
MKQMVQWLWPFGERFRQVGHQPEHLKEPIRMRNRWRLNELLPFIKRWFIVLGILGLCLYTADHLPDGPVSLLLHIVLFTATSAALGFTIFLVWLYSMRPH